MHIFPKTACGTSANGFRMPKAIEFAFPLSTLSSIPFSSFLSLNEIPISPLLIKGVNDLKLLTPQ